MTVFRRLEIVYKRIILGFGSIKFTCALLEHNNHTMDFVEKIILEFLIIPEKSLLYDIMTFQTSSNDSSNLKYGFFELIKYQNGRC